MRFYAESSSPSHVTGNRAVTNNLGVPSVSGPSSKVTQVQDQVDELKGIMVENIDQITARGERLELLINRTDNLQVSRMPLTRLVDLLLQIVC